MADDQPDSELIHIAKKRRKSLMMTRRRSEADKVSSLAAAAAGVGGKRKAKLTRRMAPLLQRLCGAGLML